MTPNADRAERTDYALLDAGEGRRLERFGSELIDRPAPTAEFWKADPAAWRDSTCRFEPGIGWLSSTPEPWPVVVDELRMEARLTSSGGVGLYPEHRTNLGWLESQIRRRLDDGQAPSVLNLFAHTGLATLAIARAGGAVTHVDSASGAVAWARRNAELSGLADRPVRWIVDDAAAFVARESRRDRRYEGIVLDPPSFGRAKGRRWKLEDALPDLLAACAAIATEDAFVLLTAHTTGLDGRVLAGMLGNAFPARTLPQAAALTLEAESGVRLDLGRSVRMG